MLKAKQILYISSRFQQKKADELEYWLLLCDKSEFYPSPEKELLTGLKSIIKIVSKIISSSKKK